MIVAVRLYSGSIVVIVCFSIVVEFAIPDQSITGPLNSQPLTIIGKRINSSSSIKNAISYNISLNTAAYIMVSNYKSTRTFTITTLQSKSIKNNVVFIAISKSTITIRIHNGYFTRIGCKRNRTIACAGVRWT